MLKIKAKFKDKNGSLGYIAVNKYTLAFEITEQSKTIIICLYDVPAPNNRPCYYSSLKSFLKNWEVL